jgi:hypothetical protein
MRSINLLPRKPLIKKIFLPLLLLSILFSLSLCAGLLYFTTNYQIEFKDNTNEMQAMETRMQQLTKEREIDPLTPDFIKYSALVQKLKSQQMYWNPIYDAVTRLMPEVARVLDMKLDKSGKMLLTMDFLELHQIVDYMIRLEQSGVIEEVIVNRIARLEKKVVSGGSSDPITSTIPNEQLLNDLKSIITGELSSAENVQTIYYIYQVELEASVKLLTHQP